ncbi:MAG: hypothetical protein WC620_06595 [Methanoregula sp.]|jgi:hypothetical protein
MACVDKISAGMSDKKPPFQYTGSNRASQEQQIISLIFHSFLSELPDDFQGFFLATGEAISREAGI